MEKYTWLFILAPAGSLIVLVAFLISYQRKKLKHEEEMKTYQVLISMVNKAISNWEEDKNDSSFLAVMHAIKEKAQREKLSEEHIEMFESWINSLNLLIKVKNAVQH